ncbi:MAG TPA: replication-associated recombination protein A [Bacteroidales bacterium]|nr:AAA family ATPase [Bacteroidales bacterium]HOU96193.1 replication-associated recombination protein A [Bacteroidales bacterium]HQG36055.1 replication-associated recombination protein A [Bacteroidales bacterium]HQG52817.1 replication-associated recombination protein A [Bacteroidales bacterium]HQJ20834.1 replication-associated recombination protein A [Bacteroidales bacterium]
MLANQPLAERMRPVDLDDFVGQEHLVGPDAILRKAIDSGKIPSFILWGPPGTGKTTIAKIIANKLKRPFFQLSAVHSGVKDVRDTIEKAKKQQFFDRPNPILFIDEIHRFNKSQQDSLLSAVEQGIITLIGATTENPSFEVIPPLLSRCQVYIMNPLSEEDLLKLIERALKKDIYLSKYHIYVKEYEALLKFAGGDARKLYNALEFVVASEADKDEPGEIIITNEKVQKIVQKKMALYDRAGDQHYDIISAFIKSIRGSDPNAAVYWLARMVEGGEDPLFIARRMVILAAEDIGLANPNALLMAQTCFEAVNVIGWPESRIILSEAAIYLATSPKSNSSYMAIENAQSKVKETGDLPVPLHLRNAPTPLMKDLGYSKDYKYAHNYQGNFIQDNFLPEEIRKTIFYEPGDNQRENDIRKRLMNLWKEYYKYD